MANNAPAFPLDVRGDMEFSPPGMDLRDYFAAHAIQGMLMLANNDNTDREIASFAYGIADAMMEVRGND